MARFFLVCLCSSLTK